MEKVRGAQNQDASPIVILGPTPPQMYAAQTFPNNPSRPPVGILLIDSGSTWLCETTPKLLEITIEALRLNLET